MVEIETSSSASKFLAEIEPYIASKKDVGPSYNITLKDSAIGDPQKYREIVIAAKQVGGEVKTVKSNGSNEIQAVYLLIPKTVAVKQSADPIGNEKTEMFLTESMIEDGGPQPRTKIDINEAGVKKLYDSLEKYGQLEPVKGYPSPTTPGKFRLSNGHTRRYLWLGLLRKPTLWAIIENRTEIEAYRDALIVNDARNSLTAYDVGHYVKEVLMKKFSGTYPTYRSLEDDLNLDHSYIVQCVLAYETVEKERGNLPEETVAKATKLTEHQLRPIRKIESPEARTAALKEVAEKDLPSGKVTELVEQANAGKAPAEIVSEMQAEDERKKQEAADERAKNLLAETEKTDKQQTRQIEKILAALSPYFDEELIEEVYGSFNPFEGNEDETITVDSVRERCQALNNHWFTQSKANGKFKEDLEAVTSEASAWKL